MIDNDKEIAAGRMFRYSRSCACGKAIQSNELPMPDKCPPCLAKDAESIPAPPAAPL